MWFFKIRTIAMLNTPLSMRLYATIANLLGWNKHQILFDYNPIPILIPVFMRYQRCPPLTTGNKKPANLNDYAGLIGNYGQRW